MFGGDTAPHNNSHLYSSHSAGGISSTKGYRSNYYGAYQYDIPQHNDLLVLNNRGYPASDVVWPPVSRTCSTWRGWW